MQRRKALAERVTWHHRTGDWIAEAWHGDEYVKLFKDHSGLWEVQWRESGRKRFRQAGGWEPAKIEALRIVQSAVLKAAKEWED